MYHQLLPLHYWQKVVTGLWPLVNWRLDGNLVSHPVLSLDLHCQHGGQWSPKIVLHCSRDNQRVEEPQEDAMLCGSIWRGAILCAIQSLTLLWQLWWILSPAGPTMLHPRRPHALRFCCRTSPAGQRWTSTKKSERRMMLGYYPQNLFLFFIFFTALGVRRKRKSNLWI